MGKSIDETLKRLAEKASVLHARTDAANEVIEKANRELSSMNLGLEVWLLSVEFGETSGQHEVPCFRQLGFAKVDGAWQLAIREWAPAMEGEYGAPRVALAKHSREMRIKASAHIQPLIEEITRQVDDALQSSSGTPNGRQSKP